MKSLRVAKNYHDCRVYFDGNESSKAAYTTADFCCGRRYINYPPCWRVVYGGVIALINLVFYLYPRTHSGGDGSRFNKASFEARWLLALEACKERSSVFFKFLGSKTYFTDR